MSGLHKASLIIVLIIGIVAAGITGAYWWSNVPPKRPPDVSADAVFLWTGGLGLPAPKHGTWIECWTDAAEGVNKCRLTEMDGKITYEGVFLTNTGKNPVSESDLKIDTETTSNRTFWVRFDMLRGAPLVFLRNGIVLIPRDAYEEGMATLEHLRQEQAK